MAPIAVWLKVDEELAVEALQDAGGKLDRADGEIVVDLSAVRRIDAPALRALEEFAIRADEKDVKVVLRGVNVDVYKVLKLMKLTSRFAFTS